MPPIRVISLLRHTKRRADFQQRNAHVPFTFFDAVDGRELTAADIDATGAFAPELRSTYDAHAYGCTLSHWHLWKEAAAGDAPLTIVEDDAVFRHDFGMQSEQLLRTLPPDWDMVLWGWNFDATLHVRPMADVSPVMMTFDQKQLRKSLAAFQQLQSPVQALRLETAFGVPAYTLSAGGARRLLALCFPQKPLAIFVPGTGRRIGNVGIDVSTSAAYPQAKCFACFPPLVATPNSRGEAPPTA
jgi:GR25 family glycosyltransferase involved in LPS biosynthesis